MPGDVTAEDVKCSYLLSHELGLKGVTVFRDGSRQEQVLHITGNNTGEKQFTVKPSRYIADYVQNNIHEPYVREQMIKILKEQGIDEGAAVLTSSQEEEAMMTATTAASAASEISKKGQHAAMQVMPSSSASSSSNEDTTCPSCRARLVITEGCNICIECGFSSCASG
jgi:ribonucleoside-diphosphate reductase alpha chain